jgi:hypothetical protein
MLQVDPRQRARLVEIVRNLQDRIAEAKAHGWLGEVEGLKVSLDVGAAKLAALDRTARRREGAVHLGLPALPAG